LGECGQKGFAVRMINCIWTITGIPAGQLCKQLSQPKARKTCQMSPCSDGK